MVVTNSNRDILQGSTVDGTVNTLIGILDNTSLSVPELMSTVELHGVSLEDAMKVGAGVYYAALKEETVRFTSHGRISLHRGGVRYGMDS